MWSSSTPCSTASETTSCPTTSRASFTPPGFWGHIKSWFAKQIDLAIAWFLQTHVEDAYRFLMRYYQEGD
jgi:hypothetical protein